MARGRDEDDDGDETPGRVRLDKWLWAARFFKTRSLAAEAIDGGKVDLNGDRAKRSKLVAVGDEVRVRISPYEHVLRVTGIGERRGSAAVAATLYQETPESKSRRETLATQMRDASWDFRYDRGRPDKKERRDIKRFRDKH